MWLKEVKKVSYLYGRYPVMEVVSYFVSDRVQLEDGLDCGGVKYS